MTAVDVVFLDTRAARRAGAKAPRLRFDRVVLSVFQRLRAGLADLVPEGATVIVTITAPIRQGSKTTETLQERIRELLGKRGTQQSFVGTVQGNQVRVRVVRSTGGATAAKLAGFVHNRDSDPGVLFESLDSLLRQIGAIKRPRARTGDRWLVVASNDGPSWVNTYKHVCSQLFAQTDLARVFFVDCDLRVSSLGD